MSHSTSLHDVAAALPAQAGIGLRSIHYQEILATLPDIGWFEVHSENYFVDGGPAIAANSTIRFERPGD